MSAPRSLESDVLHSPSRIACMAASTLSKSYRVHTMAGLCDRRRRVANRKPPPRSATNCSPDKNLGEPNRSTLNPFLVKHGAGFKRRFSVLRVIFNQLVASVFFTLETVRLPGP